MTAEPRMIVSLDQLPDPCPEQCLDGLAGKALSYWRRKRKANTGPAWFREGKTFNYRRAALERYFLAQCGDDAPSTLRSVEGGRK